jgi:hypothetical protein
MSNSPENKGEAKFSGHAQERRLLDGRARRLTAWCGIGMVAAIVINGPLSQALQRTPSYWDPGAGEKIAAYLEEGAHIDQMLVFFALSNLIFVFSIGFFAGLRRVSNQSDLTDWVNGVVSIGSAIFLAGGLLSETLSTGIAVVLRSTPDYHLDANSALLLQGLWSTALAQGQVALGIVIITISAASLHAGGLPRWLAWFGVIAGIVTILRPLLITQIPLFIASFQPVFLWIAAVSVVLLSARRRPPIGQAVSPAHLA